MFSNYWGFCLKAGKFVQFFFSGFPHRLPSHGGRCFCRQQHLFVGNGQAKFSSQGNGESGAQRSPIYEHTPWGQSHFGGRQCCGWKRFSGSFITLAFATITKITRNKHRRNLTSIIEWTATDLLRCLRYTLVDLRWSSVELGVYVLPYMPVKRAEVQVWSNKRSYYFFLLYYFLIM